MINVKISLLDGEAILFAELNQKERKKKLTITNTHRLTDRHTKQLKVQFAFGAWYRRLL